jgi:predicted acetylornithine/succinylornithine family transaminase
MNNLDQKYILNLYARLPLVIKRGQGSFIYDENNTKYLDMFGGIAVNILGHNHRVIKKAIKEQGFKYLHVSNYFANKPSVELAQLLVEHTKLAQVFFSNSGTEAIEASIKFARKWGKQFSDSKTDLIALSDAFHGRTSGAMALTSKPEYKKQFAPLLPGIKHIVRNDIKQLNKTINANTCAIFLEMVQGEGGIHHLTKAYVKEILKLKKKYKFLIIVDEIQSGMMRTGKLFAYEYYKFKPDMVAVAKGLGGGLPLGATIINKDLAKLIVRGDHGTTFGGNPLSSALGLALTKEVLRPAFVKQMLSNATFMKLKLVRLKKKYPNIIKDVRGIGFMVGVDVGDKADLIKKAFFEKKVLINVTSKTVIRLLPAINISRGEIRLFLKTFDKILANSK